LIKVKVFLISLENFEFPNALQNKINTMVDDKSDNSDSDVRSRVSCRSLVPADEARKMALQHMRPKRENVESSKDFVINSRNILIKEIQVSDIHVIV